MIYSMISQYKYQYQLLGCSESKFTCLYNKSQYGHDIASLRASSKKECLEKCCENTECIGFDWDEKTENCWLSETPWSTAPLTNHNNRYACELKEIGTAII